MEYRHFDDIEPNNRTNFATLYYSACQTMQKLERAIRRRNSGRPTFVQFMCMKKLYRKFAQMSAVYKSRTNNTKES